MNETPPQDTSTASRAQLSPRALLSLLFLAVLTVASLTLAWWWPDNTSWHFVWVAQVVPVLYGVLMWWGSTDLQESDDGD